MIVNSVSQLLKDSKHFKDIVWTMKLWEILCTSIEFKVRWLEYWRIEWNKRIWIIVQKGKECLNSLTDEDDKLLEGKEDEYMKEIEGEEKRIMLLEEYVIVEY